MKPMSIDGSYGEGGGQLTRLTLALAALTGRSVHLSRIRAGRARPGLRAQHLAAARAVAALCGGELQGDRVDSCELYFRPGRIAAGDFRFEVGTAGSITLVLQAVLPVALRAGKPCRLTITGGTDVPMAPPLDYLRLVFLPLLEQMGVKVEIECIRRGYYPRGGGEVRFGLDHCPDLKPLQRFEAGTLHTIAGTAHVAHLPGHIAERMAQAARETLAENQPMQIAAHVLDGTLASGPGGAIVLAARTTTSILGAAAVARKGVPAEQIGSEAGHALWMELDCGAAVDVHAADQLLIYLAMAKGRSQLFVRGVSQHAQTAMWIIEKFLPVRFTVQPWQGLYRIDVAQIDG
ncbi:RNA 3'-terminal phosphate cyclase [Desulfobulbus alkaliphilus]|uniref:RNA 3'-terminal phosphate cyclase n=1 Tax=Desulfobulbus alkaliphilus TaxID=869814 RepID=UPI0019632BC7|nr:RNA 3'-terminal phosphate cyclase [Desulfobulbus alkaliphilus]MBM9535631.1 RNA 3'-phosphate cyclase [Desulfobulbus alkaliphilus]